MYAREEQNTTIVIKVCKSLVFLCKDLGTDSYCTTLHCISPHLKTDGIDKKLHPIQSWLSQTPVLLLLPITQTSPKQMLSCHVVQFHQVLILSSLPMLCGQKNRFQINDNLEFNMVDNILTESLFTDN